MAKYSPLNIICNDCGYHNNDTVKVVSLEVYSGTILKAIWCQKCKNPQCVRYKFIKEKTEIIERIDPKTIYRQRKQSAGITIKPKGSRQSQNEGDEDYE